MLKRQETLVSSSSRRETPPPPENHHARSIGCLAGIFHLFSKYQNRRKFLTSGFGRDQNKDGVSSPEKAKPSAVGDKEDRNIRKISGDVTRSPTLRPEIRQSNPVKPQGNLKTKMAMAESTAEKRRKLLAALERCNQDLEELKKIIEEHLQDQRTAVTVRTLNAGKEGEEEDGGNLKWSVDFNIEQPSPVSVLDDLIHSPVTFSSKQGLDASVQKMFNNKYCNSGRKQLQQTPKPRKKPGEEESISSGYFFKNVITGSLEAKHETSALPVMQRSKAMIETVDAVCEDISWGEKREVGRIGLELQDYICRELIEEVAGELGCSYIYSLPLEACKRRLSF